MICHHVQRLDRRPDQPEFVRGKCETNPLSYLFSLALKTVRMLEERCSVYLQEFSRPGCIDRSATNSSGRCHSWDAPWLQTGKRCEQTFQQH